MKVPVKIVLDAPTAKIPEYAKSGDAGADVRVVRNSEEKYFVGKKFTTVEGKEDEFEAGDYLLPGRSTTLVSLGFRIELPEGWEMQVRSRSGLAKRGIVVANSPGTIDAGYRGTCMVLLTNNNSESRLLKAGTRIAQFVLKEAPQAEFLQTLDLSGTDRGKGGFGSTGVE